MGQGPGSYGSGPGFQGSRDGVLGSRGSEFPGSRGPTGGLGREGQDRAWGGRGDGCRYNICCNRNDNKINLSNVYEQLLSLSYRGGWGKSGQGQIGPLVYINVTFEMNIGIKVVMIWP